MLPTYRSLSLLKKKEVESSYNFNALVLADSASQYLATAISGHAKYYKINLNVLESEYDTIDLEINNENSALNKSNFDFLLLNRTTEKLYYRFQMLDTFEKKNFANILAQWYDNFAQKYIHSAIIINNFYQIGFSVFGNYASNVEHDFNRQLRKLNYLLDELTSKHKHLKIINVDILQSYSSIENRIDYRFYYSASLTFGLQFLPALSKSYIDIIKAIKGIELKKCIIFDLDNTLWGGIIGDDGLENIEIGNIGNGKIYTEIQMWAKELKERGVILCVCSKNNEDTAQSPFLEHEEMILNLKDISVFVANWNNKADNIRYIQSVLEIGFDSMVFIDDNPAERLIVKNELPLVTVPELPDDPINFLHYLKNLNLFETSSFVEDDSNRTEMYQKEAARRNFSMNFSSMDDYLSSLKMVCRIQELNEKTIPRVAQLSQRSNQFNLRTIRYNENDLVKMANDESIFTACFELSDIFGSHGLISVIIAKRIKENTFLIDTWIMSCRVLKRGMEEFCLNYLMSEVKKKNIEFLVGEYIPTQKNKIVIDHYKNLGFIQNEENLWIMETGNYFKIPTKIEIEKQ